MSIPRKNNGLVTLPCNLAVHGEWSDWGSWSPCSVSCGEGEQTRSRRCENPAPNEYGDYCTGVNVTSQLCTEEECPG